MQKRVAWCICQAKIENPERGTQLLGGEQHMSIRTVDESVLNSGDVIMFRGTDLIARLIIEFDGGHYSHSAIYVGDGDVVEAVAQGVIRRPLSDSIAAQKPERVDVFRFSSDTHTVLDGQLPYDPPVKARVDHYLDEGNRYAYEDLILLALLTTVRQISVIGPALLPILDAAAEVVARILAEGKHPLICSALVFRCFEESGPQYHIHVPDAELLAAVNATDTQMNTQQIAFLRQFIFATGDLSEKVTCAHPISALGIAEKEPAPDFVTPRDLEFSPNLNKIGRLG
jgi:hypothetical protein